MRYFRSHSSQFPTNIHIAVFAGDIQMLLTMNFSSRTTSLDVQRNLEANVEKRTKDTFGPPLGKKLLVFIDDMNMPQVNSLFFFINGC